MTTAGLLELLLAGASREELDAAVADAESAGTRGEELADLRRERELALQVHEQMARQRSREAELSALYDTAHDLTAIRDPDGILAAIVRRARQLLHADMTYLSLNDEAEGASYMKVTDGALTAEFRKLRLPLGTGLLGLVAQTGAPYFIEDYQADQRFLHREYIDTAVAGEQIRAILGVPLSVDGVVIGALLAVHRSVRFPASEVALLTWFAAHASVALENARLFEDVAEANLELRQRSEATEQALLAVVLGLILHSFMYAPQAAYFTELFGTSVRYTGASVGYQLASTFAGALAPIIALKLLGDVNDGNTAAVGIYVAIAAVLTIVSVLASKETRSTSLRHDRVVADAHS
ncbi:MAG: GAF domain-containing protein [Sporichthyaceae bacterium]